MTGLFPMRFTSEQKCEAIERELSFRRRVFERRVAEGKMTQKKADYEIAIFEAILADYEGGGA
jgi:hypothetical protein